MLTKEDALELLYKNWSPSPIIETIPLGAAYGRVLAQDAFAQYTLPVVRAAVMDSVALLSERFENGMPDTDAWRRSHDYELADMGDDFNDKFDCAIPVEHVTFSTNGRIKINDGTTVKPGVGIRQSGSTVKENDLLLTKGCRIIAIDLAVLAIGGIEWVNVYKKPIVAIIPTGSELIARGQKPCRGENIEANSILLENMLIEMGAQPLCYPIVRDDPEEMTVVLQDALKAADIIVINGGSSKGSEDFTTRLLSGQGEFLFHGVSAAPGKPLGISVVDGKPVINLPGPPPAAFSVADWCLRGIVSKYLNIPVSKRSTVKAVLTEPLDTPLPMEFTARVNVRKSNDGIYLAEPIAMGRDALVRTVGANGKFISPIGQSRFEKGEIIDVELIRSEEYI